MNHFLTIKQLQLPYPKSIQPFDLNVKKGEILAILGQNGSGKTTFLRVLAGFEKSISGQIILDKILLNDSNYLLPVSQRRMGLVFQDFVLFPHLTVYENIVLGLFRETKKIQQEKYQKISENLDILTLEKKYPHQISGGEQQKVALARSLVLEPSLLLLDEPFANWDIYYRQKHCKKLREMLKKVNSTVILVTHDLESAKEMADEQIDWGNLTT